MLINKKRSVKVSIDKAFGKKKLFEFIIPSSRSMFKSIKSCLELADMGWIFRINKPWGLRHVDVFNKVTMQKGMVKVKLAERPPMKQSKT